MSTIPVFDGHNDTILDLLTPERGKGRTFFARSEYGHLDLPRAQEGGFAGGLFACYTPNAPWSRGGLSAPTPRDPAKPFQAPLPNPVDYEYAARTTLALFALAFRLEAASEGQFRIARSADEIEQNTANGVISAVLHIEGAEAIDPELNALHVLYQAGLRSLGPVWSRPTLFAHGVPFQFNHSPDTGPGLTDLGKKLVRECNQLGIMVDLSHMNEAGFWDVAKLSDAPLVASHSNVHALCPATRNLTDPQMDAIKESGGLAGLNFGTVFLREDGRDDPDTPISRMVEHIDYMVERMGVDHVGFGSDFDGTGMPGEFKDVTGLPKLLDALRARGYDDEALRKIAYGNWLRVLRTTWQD